MNKYIMKFLLLFIGLVCCIAGLFFIKNDEQKKQSIWLTLVGGFLIIANCFYLWYSVANKIEIVSVIVVIIFVIIFIAIYYRGKDKNLEWGFASSIIIALILFMTFGGKLPSVTLDNGVIKMGGNYGGVFKVSDIQSVDTVSVIPRVGMKRHGAGLPTSSIGNYALANESKTAKLCIYRYNPPYIMIRMNDNSLFIFNFSKPDETVEFYNQLKEKL